MVLKNGSFTVVLKIRHHRDEAGLIYVGNDGRDNVEIYSPQGELQATWGTGVLSMPNSLARDQFGNLYVAFI